MHILLPALGLVVTILVLLNRLNQAGVDLSSFNPFLWQRRRAWARKYRRNSIYALTEPMDVVAVLMTALAKSDGDMSREQKQMIIDIFESEFLLDNSRSRALLESSVHLLTRLDGQPLNVARTVLPCLEQFSTEKAISALQWLHDIAVSDGPLSSVQQNILNEVYRILDDRFKLELLYNT